MVWCGIVHKTDAFLVNKPEGMVMQDNVNWDIPVKRNEVNTTLGKQDRRRVINIKQPERQDRAKKNKSRLQKREVYYSRDWEEVPILFPYENLITEKICHYFAAGKWQPVPTPRKSDFQACAFSFCVLQSPTWLEHDTVVILTSNMPKSKELTWDHWRHRSPIAKDDKRGQEKGRA